MLHVHRWTSNCGSLWCKAEEPDFFFWGKNWFVFNNPPRVGSTPPVICFNCLQLRAAASVPSITLLLNIIMKKKYIKKNKKNKKSQWRSFRFDVVTQICDINYPGLSPVDSGDGSDICSACLQDASLWRLFLSHREGTTARKIKNMLEGSDTPSGLAMPQDPPPHPLNAESSTGEGKSFCFKFPSVCSSCICIIVSQD